MTNSTSIHCLSPQTILAHGGQTVEDHVGSIVQPIYPGTTFVRNSDYSLQNDEFSYSRSGMPNWSPVEHVMCELEGGFAARLFGSGLAAATVFFQALKPGDHCVIPDIMYHGLRDYVIDFCKQWSIGLSFYRTGNTDSLASVIVSNTRLVWVETPANPSWQVTDIAAAAQLCKDAGALCIVDSTVATPLLTQPISLGADFVMHSATKYLNGHSDVLGGVAVAAKDSEFWQKICALRTGSGAILGAFESWLLARGLRTLDVRLERACNNTMALAEMLEGHSAIEAVLYPGLPSHPGHEIASKQMHGGFGAMMSILVNGDESFAKSVAGRTRVFKPATSLGGVESLIEHRATVEGKNSPVPGNLLRLSIGIESIDDLRYDLISAIEH